MTHQDSTYWFAPGRTSRPTPRMIARRRREQRRERLVRFAVATAFVALSASNLVAFVALSVGVGR